MEPVFMILGQSAATAAVLAIETQSSVQQVSYEDLRERLIADGQVLEAPPEVAEAIRQEKSRSIPAENLDGLVRDNQQATLTGVWQSSTASMKFVGANYLHDGDSRNGKATALFKFTIPETDRYEIRVSYPPNNNRASNTPVTIRWSEGEELKRIDQRAKPTVDPLMASLGQYDFNAGEEVNITISNQNADGYVIVDAIQIVSVP